VSLDAVPVQDGGALVSTAELEVSVARNPRCAPTGVPEGGDITSRRLRGCVLWRGPSGTPRRRRRRRDHGLQGRNRSSLQVHDFEASRVR